MLPLDLHFDFLGLHALHRTDRTIVEAQALTFRAGAGAGADNAAAAVAAVLPPPWLRPGPHRKRITFKWTDRG
jgi:hypothetical protein